MKTPKLLRSFRSRNYRLFFAGQAVSLVGGWMAITASMWLAFRLTGSAFYVGLVGFASQIPLLLLAPFTSVVGDRVDRRRLLMLLQVFSFAQIMTLAVVTLSGHVTVWIMVVLAAVQGIVNAFEFPVRQSFVVEMVAHRDDLPNALALNSSVFNLARLIGPTAAGITIEFWGEGVCYLLNGFGYIAVMASLWRMRVRAFQPSAQRKHPWQDFLSGLSYVHGEGRVRRPLLLVGVVALAGFGAHTLAPVLAGDVFGGDARLLGRFYSVVGGGALLAALYLGSRPEKFNLRPWIVYGTFAGALGSLIVALSEVLWLTYIGYLIDGAAVVLAMVGCNTLIQARVSDDKRGRVMGLFVTATGAIPIGQLLVGWVAEHGGARLALILCAVVLAIAAIAFAKPRSRQSLCSAKNPDPRANELPRV